MKFISALCLAAALVSCGGSDPETPTAQAGDGAAPAAPSHISGAENLPEDKPRFVPADDWVVEPPGRMRLHQYRVPGADLGEDGRAEDGLLVVASWPSNVGGLEANLRNWIQQSGMDLELSELTEEHLVESEVRHFVVHTLYLEGAAEAEGGEAAEAVHGASGRPMMVAYIEKAGYAGVWTVKLTGSLETIRAHREGFRAFLERM